MKDMNIDNIDIEDINNITINKEDLEIAKNNGKKLFSRLNINEQVNKLTSTFNNNEILEFYFVTENIDTAIAKNFAVAIAPTAGLAYSQWKSNLIFVLSNTTIYLINNNFIMNQIDITTIPYDTIKNMIYYNAKSRKVLQIVENNASHALLITKNTSKDYLDIILSRFKVKTKHKEYSNKKKRFLNLLYLINIMAVIFAILFMVYRIILTT